MLKVLFQLYSLTTLVNGCSDFYMKFQDENFKLSARTNDLGSLTNWTFTTWPSNSHMESIVTGYEDKVFRWTSKYDTLGMSGNWYDDRTG